MATGLKIKLWALVWPILSDPSSLYILFSYVEKQKHHKTNQKALQHRALTLNSFKVNLALPRNPLWWHAK